MAILNKCRMPVQQKKLSKKMATKVISVGENSILSKTTFGDTEYIAYGSINIKQLAFIFFRQKI